METQTLEKPLGLAGIHPVRLFAGSCIALISTAFAAILVVVFGVLYIRDRRQGGYKAEKI